jgi:hypothetical protein
MTLHLKTSLLVRSKQYDSHRLLLNHDAAHQVMHCVSTAYELAQPNPEISVVIISWMKHQAPQATIESKGQHLYGIAGGKLDRLAMALENFTVNGERTINCQ